MEALIKNLSSIPVHSLLYCIIMTRSVFLVLLSSRAFHLSQQHFSHHHVFLHASGGQLLSFSCLHRSAVIRIVLSFNVVTVIDIVQLSRLGNVLFLSICESKTGNGKE